MADPNFNEILEYVNNGNYQEAIDRYIKFVDDKNEKLLSVILEGLKNVLTLGGSLSKEQLEQIKPHIIDFDEHIQEASIDIYITALKKSHNLISQELDFCIEKLSDYESVIRDKFIDFYIDIFKTEPDFRDKIIEVFLKRIWDEFWTIRMKVAVFFANTIKKYPDLIKKYKMKFLPMLNEADLDVIREDLDFLLNLIQDTFSAEELSELINSIPDRNWYAQEKILWLSGEIGKNKIDLILTSIPNLIKFLNYDDYFVQKKATETLIEIMTNKISVLDNAIFSMMQDEEIENIAEVENILAQSILIGEYKRFYDIFTKISPIVPILSRSFANIIKILFNTEPELIKQYLTDLVRYIFSKFSLEEYIKLKAILEIIPMYNVYLVCYNVLNEMDPITNDEIEDKRIDLINYLLGLMPELGYVKLSIWLNNKIKSGPVFLTELCDRYSIDRKELMNILETMIKRDLLNVVIIEDQIQLPTIDKLVEESKDVLFSKKWEIKQKPDDVIPEIHLFVKIQNVSDKPIKRLNAIVDYPRKIFTFSDTSQQNKKQAKNLNQSSDIVFDWVFHKKMEKNTKSMVAGVKLIFLYEKEGKISTIIKKLDMLIL